MGLGVARQVLFREGDVPIQTGWVGHGVLVDDFFKRLAQKQFFDGQLLLFAREGARDLGHLHDSFRIANDALLDHQATFCSQDVLDLRDGIEKNLLTRLLPIEQRQSAGNLRVRQRGTGLKQALQQIGQQTV